MIEITSLDTTSFDINTEPFSAQGLNEHIPIPPEAPFPPITTGRIVNEFSKILFAPENRVQIVLATLLTGCKIGAHFLSPYLLGKLTKSFSVEEGSTSKTWLITGIVVSQVFSKIFDVAIDTISVSLEAKTTQKLFQKTTEHLLNKSLDYHVQTSLSDMYNLLTKCFSVQKLGISLITQTIPMVVEIGCASVILYSQFDPIVGISILLLTAAYVIYGVVTTQYVFEIRENFNKVSDETFIALGNMLSRYKVIQDCSGQEKCLKEITKSLEKLKDSWSETFSKPNLINLVPSLFSYSHMLFVLLYVARGIQSGRYTAENFTTLLGYLGSFTSLLQGISSSVDRIFSGYPDLKFLFKELCKPKEILDPYPETSLSIIDAPTIEFDHISFAYPTKDESLFQDLCFTIPAGKKVAIVSRSGAGKTSLFNLLYRYYQPSAGTIKIAGQDIHKVGLQSLQSQICILGQNPNLFQGTIRENILFGAANTVTDEEILALANSLGFQDLFETLSLDTDVGEGGKSLSGGQQQKVALLRSLMKTSPILLLDEATASLDVVSATQMLQTLLTSSKVTTLMITHKLSEARIADEILLIGEGKVLGMGTHQDLLEKNSFYQDLWNAHQNL